MAYDYGNAKWQNMGEHGADTYEWHGSPLALRKQLGLERAWSGERPDVINLGPCHYCAHPLLSNQSRWYNGVRAHWRCALARRPLG